MASCPLTDVHAHLEMAPFDNDRDAVVDRARRAGLVHIVCVGADLAGSRRAVQLSARYPDLLRATVGIHPSSCTQAGESDFDSVEELARRPEVVGIGETGLDFHYDYTPRPDQIEAFERHVALARRLDLPLMIHSRKAHEETLEVLRAAGGPLRGVRHCFDRPWLEAEPYLELGLHISIGGAITREGYKRFKAAAARIPLDRLLLETDCPYQSPAAHQGERNEPAFIVDVLETLALLRGMPPADLAAATTANAEALFGLRPAATP